MPHDTSIKSVTYADAGVDIRSGDRAKERIKYLAQKTFNRNVLGGIGGFGALFRLDLQRWKNPILVSSADGVGTKLKVAFELGLHQTVGADLVNHCVNDIAVQGATPLFFLDYLATRQARPGGDRERGERAGRCLQGQRLRADRRRDGADAGLLCRWRVRSGGIHRGRGGPRQDGDRRGHQGRRRARSGCPRPACTPTVIRWRASCFFEVAGYKPTQYVTAIKEKAGAALMKTHRSYLHVIQKLVTAGLTTGMAHITGGGITENLPRILPKNIAAQIEIGSWPVLPIFEHLRALGQVSQEEMMRTFNMGIGLIAAIPGGQVYARQKPAGPRRGEVLRHRPRGQGRAPGAVHVSRSFGGSRGL